jgi:ribonuclease Z
MDKDFFTLAAPRFTIEGRSRAGHETWFRVRDLGVMLDLGRGPDAAVGVSNVFITHAHLDHAAGIPFYAGQRQLHGMPRGRIWVPAEAADGFRELLGLWERLTNSRYDDVEIRGIAAGESVRISRSLEVRAHAATHRVAANAYELVEVRHRLTEEGLSQEEIQRRRDEVIEEYRAPLLFYTGDTDRGILEKCDALYRAEVLMIECSFIVEGHQERAARYRHIHFDDIAAFAGRFQNELVILTHFSRRYGRAEIRDEIARRCPAVLRDRLRLALPEPYQRV